MSTISATPNTRMEWINYLRDLKTRMMKVDPVRTPSLLQRLEKDMRDRESSAAEFDTMEQYLPFRLKNFDFEAVSQMLLWGMDIDLSFAELESDLLAKIKYSSGIIAVLANDYFSWEREKRQQYDSDRIRNAVAVLMKQDDVSEEEAKEGVKKIIIEEEGRIRNLLAVAQETGKVSEALRRYLDGLQSFASGYQFWCATCLRYSQPEGDSN
ncbi:hypothetical protein V5O48_006531 [Marasmius crinis-equi]|uniref:Terpene synthase n=1 Tax=Marasmius crinis-equi TaxID=585013 RepID=A0ABR3FJ83_9AGAR